MISVVEQASTKRIRGLRALFLLPLLALAACGDAPRHLHEFSGATMGTTWSVKTMGLPANSSGEQLHSDIRLLLESVNNQMSTWQTDSHISRFNAAEADSWHQLPPDFFRVLDYSLWLAGETGGAYDPTVGPLVNLWGFGPGGHDARVPSDEELAAVRDNIGYQRLDLDPEGPAARQPGELYLDLSSVAKGYAVDKVADFLDARGVDAFLVEIGGELRGQGRKPGQQPWRIAIEQPLRDARKAGKVIALTDLSMATSGDYRNFHEIDGQLYSHTLDPRTGSPVDHGLALVTVLHESCMEADALATALQVMGPEAGQTFAEERELAARFMVREGDGFREITTAAFRRHTSEVEQP